MDEARNTKKNNLKRADFILIGNYKYLVYKTNKKSVELLPINYLMDTEGIVEMIPRMKVDYTALENYKKIDNNELYLLINQTNPLIQELLEIMFENESRKN